jgi:hypothetical protein
MPVDTHEEDRQMSTPGQSKLDNPAYCELARDYCLVGATNEVLADFFGVTRRTIQNWMATHRDFADAVREGRVAADAKVGRALFERATGFSEDDQMAMLDVASGACAMRPVSWSPGLHPMGGLHSRVKQQNERRKGRKGREPRILRKQGPFRGRREGAETRRKPAETPCTAASFSAAEYRRLISSSPEKLSGLYLSHSRGALQSAAPAIGAAKQQEKGG